MNVPWSHRGSLMLILVDNSPAMAELVYWGQINEVTGPINQLLLLI